MKSVIIKVKDIHCKSCENTIYNTLQKIPGVLHVLSSAERNEVSVGYDGTKIGEDDLREKLADLGYEPTV